MFFGSSYDSISVRTYGFDLSFTEVTAMARLARAEVFDPREVAVLLDHDLTLLKLGMTRKWRGVG